MRNDGRDYVTITKTREQAEFERQHPYQMYECPECGEALPVVPYSWTNRKIKELGDKSISVYSREIDSLWHDFLYEMWQNYYKKKFVDEYKCKSCGAEWKTQPYVCNVKDKTEMEAKKLFGI